LKARLQRIEPGRRSLGDYEALFDREELERIRGLAAGLGGHRLIYLGLAPGESADPAASLVPLLRDLGLEAERAVLHGDAEFADAARALDDSLRGSDWLLSAERWPEFGQACEAAAVYFDLRGYDTVLVTGPANAALIEGRRSERARWIWRTWADLSRPQQAAWEALRPLLDAFVALVFAEDRFAPDGIDGERLRIVSGAIDPMLASHRELGAARLGDLAREAGVDPSRPLVCVVARLDCWIDPLAAIESWRLAREQVPGLQLAIGGRIDAADPEASGIAAEIEAFAGDEPDLLVLTDRHAVSPEQLGAVQQIARCQLHCPLADGFDPALAGAMWKGTPVLGPASNEERAARIVSLCREPGRAARMGRQVRQRARTDLLIPRLLADELRLLSAPKAEGTRRGATRAAA
jgi:trehalose synthase